MNKSIDTSDLYISLDENEYLSDLNKKLNEMGYDNVDNINDAHKYIFPDEYNWVLEEIYKVKQQENLPPMRTGDHFHDILLTRKLNNRQNYYPYIVNHAQVYGSNSDSYHDIILEPIRQELILLNKQIEIGNSEFSDKEYLPQKSIVKAQAVLDEIKQRISERVTLLSTKNVPIQRFNSTAEATVLTGDNTNQLIGEFLGGASPNVENDIYFKKYKKYKSKYLNLKTRK